MFLHSKCSSARVEGNFNNNSRKIMFKFRTEISFWIFSKNFKIFWIWKIQFGARQF